MPPLSLAILLPRIDALEASSLAAGYDRLEDAIGVLGDSDTGSIQANGVWAAWPLAFGATPAPTPARRSCSAFLSPARAPSSPPRPRVRVRSSRLVPDAGRGRERPVIRGLFYIPFGDVYLHNPGRMRYLAVIAIPVLGAIGIQGLRDDPLPPRARRWLAAGAVLWLGLPLLALANPLHFIVLALGLAASGWALLRSNAGRGARAWAVIGAVLAVELCASAALSQAIPPGVTVRLNLEAGEHPNLVPQPLPYPHVDATAFVTPTAFVPRLAATHDRYLTWAPPASSFEKGYLFMQLEPDWPALAMERGTLFGLHDTLGYNPCSSAATGSTCGSAPPAGLLQRRGDRRADAPRRAAARRALRRDADRHPGAARRSCRRPRAGPRPRGGRRLAATGLGGAELPGRAERDGRPAHRADAVVRSRRARRARGRSGHRAHARRHPRRGHVHGARSRTRPALGARDGAVGRRDPYHLRRRLDRDGGRTETAPLLPVDGFGGTRAER